MSRKRSNQELGRLSKEQYSAAQKNAVTIVLDNVRSLHNVGSVFRTADAFRVEQLILCGVTGTPPHREIEKTALGATETVQWLHFGNTAEAIVHLRQTGHRIFAVEQAEKSLPLNAFAYDGGRTAFVFGNEVYGVEQEIVSAADGVIEIPQAGSKHSLNVAVTVGIVLWQALGQRIK